MNPKKPINDLSINPMPKVIRFTGEKFPPELWNCNQSKRNKKISA